ncbi:hypothetical protein PR048_017163 [Dryococelus australis]|uniref:Uncharacterized protein n=1 Tax=Dryococelus australis TaxID=614101 RepID=A0ABQ9H8S1_9NEOP|nr:hypothetical protein PR048_017163 [Dryococelus australis]
MASETYEVKFTVKYIRGYNNGAADCLSRMFHDEEFCEISPSDASSCKSVQVIEVPKEYPVPVTKDHIVQVYFVQNISQGADVPKVELNFSNL